MVWRVFPRNQIFGWVLDVFLDFSSCQCTVPRVGIFSPSSLSTNERFHFLSIVHAAACRAPSPHHIAKFTPSITKSVNLSFVPVLPLPRPAGRPFFILRYVLVRGGGHERDKPLGPDRDFGGGDLP